MPPHTHSRRTEIYFYFDIPEINIVSHFLGAPDRTGPGRGSERSRIGRDRERRPGEPPR